MKKGSEGSEGSKGSKGSRMCQLTLELSSTNNPLPMEGDRT